MRRLPPHRAEAAAAGIALEEARATIADLEARLAEPAVDEAGDEALVAAQAEAAAVGIALAETRHELEDARTTIADLEAARAEPVVDTAAQESLAAMQLEAGAAADALAEARRELDAARAQIAALEEVNLERVGADVAHDTLVSLQQENEAAVAALAAASRELESANVRLAELDELRAGRARAAERMQALEARTQGLQDELASRAARIDELESRLAEHASAGEQAEPEPAEPTYDDAKHVLLVPSETGFVTLERPGPAPQPGDDRRAADRPLQGLPPRRLAVPGGCARLCVPDSGLTVYADASTSLPAAVSRTEPWSTRTRPSASASSQTASRGHEVRQTSSVSV